MKKLIQLIMIAIISTASIGTAKEIITAGVSGSNVVISHNDINANCSAKFKSYIAMNGSRISITQIDTSKDRAYCNCDFDMKYYLNSLQPGTYTADIFREYQTRYGYPSNSKEQVGKVEFTVKAPTRSVLSAFDYEQSPCKGTDVKQRKQLNGSGLQVYPNPAVSNVTIKYELESDADVTLKLYNMLGKELMSVSRRDIDAGSHSIVLNAGELPPGMYVGKLTTSEGKAYSFKLTWSK